MIIKLFVGLVVVLLTPVVAAKLVYNVTSATAEPVSLPWTQNSMEFVTWNGEEWTGWIRDEVFEHRPQNDEDWGNHASPSVAYIDWEGTPIQAKIEGDSFLLAHRGEWQGHIEHEVAIRYRDWNGNNQLRTVAQLRR